MNSTPSSIKGAYKDFRGDHYAGFSGDAIRLWLVHFSQSCAHLNQTPEAPGGNEYRDNCRPIILVNSPSLPKAPATTYADFERINGGIDPYAIPTNSRNLLYSFFNEPFTST